MTKKNTPVQFQVSIFYIKLMFNITKKIMLPHIIHFKNNNFKFNQIVFNTERFTQKYN
jgi:hypothetical protein